MAVHDQRKRDMSTLIYQRSRQKQKISGLDGDKGENPTLT